MLSCRGLGTGPGPPWVLNKGESQSFSPPLAFLQKAPDYLENFQLPCFLYILFWIQTFLGDEALPIFLLTAPFTAMSFSPMTRSLGQLLQLPNPSPWFLAVPISPPEPQSGLPKTSLDDVSLWDHRSKRQMRLQLLSSYKPWLAINSLKLEKRTGHNMEHPLENCIKADKKWEGHSQPRRLTPNLKLCKLPLLRELAMGWTSFPRVPWL